MRRTLFVLCAAIASVATANAATVTITPDKATYHVGETITLSIAGDSQGGTEIGVFGYLLFDKSLASYQGGSQQPLVSLGGSLTWLRGTLPCNTSNPREGCTAFNQIGTYTYQAVDNLLLASMQLLAVAPGALDLSWETDPSTGFQFRFFGLTNAPGTSVTIVNPEPGTAGLLGLGLFALARFRRRRAR